MIVKPGNIVKLRKAFYENPSEGRHDVLVSYVDNVTEQALIKYPDGNKYTIPIAGILESSIVRMGDYGYLDRLQRMPAYAGMIQSPKLLENLKLKYPNTDFDKHIEEYNEQFAVAHEETHVEHDVPSNMSEVGYLTMVVSELNVKFDKIVDLLQQIVDFM